MSNLLTLIILLLLGAPNRRVPLISVLQNGSSGLGGALLPFLLDAAGAGDAPPPPRPVEHADAVDGRRRDRAPPDASRDR